jgi:hypothetical protein
MILRLEEFERYVNMVGWNREYILQTDQAERFSVKTYDELTDKESFVSGLSVPGLVVSKLHKPGYPEPLIITVEDVITHYDNSMIVEQSSDNRGDQNITTSFSVCDDDGIMIGADEIRGYLPDAFVRYDRRQGLKMVA